MDEKARELFKALSVITDYCQENYFEGCTKCVLYNNGCCELYPATPDVWSLEYDYITGKLTLNG